MSNENSSQDNIVTFPTPPTPAAPAPIEASQPTAAAPVTDQAPAPPEKTYTEKEVQERVLHALENVEQNRSRRVNILRAQMAIQAAPAFAGHPPDEMTRKTLAFVGGIFKATGLTE
jgi:hypothetical protein